MDSKAEEFLEELAGPLIERIHRRAFALGIAYYDGTALDNRWPPAVAAWAQSRGVFVEHLLLRSLTGSPVTALLRRQRSQDHLFSLDISSEDLPDPALQQNSPVADLNWHRDNFRDQRLSLLLWVPRGLARRFLDLASNLCDYRTTDADVPALAALAAPAAPSTPHNLPFASIGSLFTGREAEMAALQRHLHGERATAITDPLALEGFGGIGKTRLAIEYAWRHLSSYSAAWFVRADTPETLHRELASLSDPTCLHLGLAEATPQDARLAAVLAALQSQPGWLLILDNADAEDSAAAINALLPRLGGGHILITTRFRRWGKEITPLLLDVLGEEEGVRFLLAATGPDRAVTSGDAADARALVGAVGGLPLALELLAAWIKTRGATLAEAAQEIARQPLTVLSWYERSQMRYPRSVAAVWESSLAECSADEKLLLRTLAWLSPSPVPPFLLLTLASACSQEDGHELSFDSVADALVHRSILTRQPSRALQLHRLLLQLERARTPSGEALLWNARVCRALNEATTGEPTDVRSWPRLRLLAPHAAELFERQVPGTEGAYSPFLDHAHRAAFTRLLNQFGVFFNQQADHAAAEPLMRRALAIHEQSYGAEHPKVAIRLNNLAQLLQATNRLAEAEPLMRRALAIDEQSYGAEHPNVSRDLNNLALLLQETNRLAEAELLMHRALAIDEQSYGAEHPDVARDLNNLAQLLQATNRLAEAEPLMRRALAIDEQSYGAEHPRVAIDLNNLAQLLQATTRLAEAEPLMRRALAIDEQSYGAEHPDVARDLNNLAQLLKATNRLAEAEPLMRRSLAIDEQFHGAEHPDVAVNLNNLARLLLATNRLAEAEPLMRCAVVIVAKFTATTGHEHPHSQLFCDNYHALLTKSGLSPEQAEERVRSALAEGGLNPVP